MPQGALGCSCDAPSSGDLWRRAAEPFITPPAVATMEEYVDCLLRPGIIVGNVSGQCEDFPPETPGMRMLKQHAAVAMNYSACAPLSGFADGDERAILYDPVAAYTRPRTSDGYALVQVRTPARPCPWHQPPPARGSRYVPLWVCTIPTTVDSGSLCPQGPSHLGWGASNPRCPCGHSWIIVSCVHACALCIAEYVQLPRLCSCVPSSCQSRQDGMESRRPSRRHDACPSPRMRSTASPHAHAYK